MTNEVGFIGLGSQGAPMARRIVEAGYPLVLWARRAETLAPFADTAARDRARASPNWRRTRDHVGVCVVDDAGVRAGLRRAHSGDAPGRPHRDSLHRPSRHVHRRWPRKPPRADSR